MEKTMADKNEIVTVDLGIEGRLRLSNQIYAAMEKRGLPPYEYRHLALGFELPMSWPADSDCEITLAQLVVLSKKLDMKIIIGDINLINRK